MIIIQALRSARSEYVVYFLLSAWLEVLDHNGRGRHLPAEVKLMVEREQQRAEHEEVEQRLTKPLRKFGGRPRGRIFSGCN